MSPSISHFACNSIFSADRMLPPADAATIAVLDSRSPQPVGAPIVTQSLQISLP